MQLAHLHSEEATWLSIAVVDLPTRPILSGRALMMQFNLFMQSPPFLSVMLSCALALKRLVCLQCFVVWQQSLHYAQNSAIAKRQIYHTFAGTIKSNAKIVSTTTQPPIYANNFISLVFKSNITLKCIILHTYYNFFEYLHTPLHCLFFLTSPGHYDNPFLVFQILRFFFVFSSSHLSAHTLYLFLSLVIN